MSSSPVAVCTSHTIQNTGVINFVFPSINDCEADCICPLLVVASHRCYNFASCSCLTESYFRESINICAINTSTIQICFNNLTNEMNGTNIHLFQTQYLNCQHHQSTFAYRKYIRAFMILVNHFSDPLSHPISTILETISPNNIILSSNFIHNISASVPAIATDIIFSSNNIIVFYSTLCASLSLICITLIALTMSIAIFVQKKRKGVSDNEHHIYDKTSHWIERSALCQQHLQPSVTEIQMLSNPAYETVKLSTSQ